MMVSGILAAIVVLSLSHMVPPVEIVWLATFSVEYGLHVFANGFEE